MQFVGELLKFDVSIEVTQPSYKVTVDEACADNKNGTCNRQDYNITKQQEQTTQTFMYDVTAATNVWDIQGVSASDPSIKSSSNTTVGLILQRNMYTKSLK